MRSPKTHLRMPSVHLAISRISCVLPPTLCRSKKRELQSCQHLFGPCIHTNFLTNKKNNCPASVYMTESRCKVHRIYWWKRVTFGAHVAHTTSKLRINVDHVNITSCHAPPARVGTPDIVHDAVVAATRCESLRTAMRCQKHVNRFQLHRLPRHRALRRSIIQALVGPSGVSSHICWL